MHKKKITSKNEVELIARTIGIPVSKWPGQCYAIACLMVEKGFAPGGVPVYGHWLGPVAADAPVFGDKRGFPFQRHGWIKFAHTVVDPTRWVFENAKPYIYKGPADVYDEGGNAFRGCMTRPPPAFDAAEQITPPFTDECLAYADTLILPETGWSTKQMWWLANLPYDALGEFVHEIYDAIGATIGLVAIPIDNRQRSDRER